MNKTCALILAATAAIAAIVATGCTGDNGNQRHTVLVPSLPGSTTYDGSCHPADEGLRVEPEDPAISCRRPDAARGPDELNVQASIKNVLAGVPCATVCPTCESAGGDCIHLNGGRCICA